MIAFITHGSLIFFCFSLTYPTVTNLSADFCLFTKGLSALQFLYCTITISPATLLHRNLPAASLHCLGDVSFALAQASLLLSPTASSPDTLLAPVLFAAFGPPFPTI